MAGGAAQLFGGGGNKVSTSATASMRNRQSFGSSGPVLNLGGGGTQNALMIAGAVAATFLVVTAIRS